MQFNTHVSKSIGDCLIHEQKCPNYFRLDSGDAEICRIREQFECVYRYTYRKSFTFILLSLIL